MQTDFRTFAKSISTLFSPEIQENIFFYVGDCLLYFNLAYRHKERLKYLVPGREGSGFLLEEAIKRRHKPFIKWLLNFKSFPNEYLLVSAVCHGDLSILIQIITFIGEDYKEHDTHAKIICVREGKMEMLEYLFGRNKTFHCSSTDLRKYIIEGFYNSAELYNWYLKNKKYCPLIAESICLRGLLLNNDITRAKKLLKNNKVATLIAALSSTYSAKEKTYRWIIRTLKGFNLCSQGMYVVGVC
ncbi:hypothetical protein K7432_014575 [Basidiobolus ranarum]|uniref:Ankyrin repeat protein n=1 Tax=Basidiobolus ranarum TaxID=34480 RepID=A0ABR2WHC2_9FUNG